MRSRFSSTKNPGTIISPSSEYKEPTTSLVHYLYHNQYDGEYLLPEFKHLDFLWLLKGDTVAEDFMQQLVTGIRSLSPVQLVTELHQ